MPEGNRNKNISEFATALDLSAPQIDRRLTLRSMLEDMIGQGSHNNKWQKFMMNLNGWNQWDIVAKKWWFTC
jgi:hypothetical protein